MPRPDSGFLSGVLAGIQQFKQTRQFYQQMETGALRNEASRAQIDWMEQRRADYMSPQKQAQFNRDQLGPDAIAQGQAKVASAPFQTEASNIVTQGGIDYASSLPTPEPGIGQDTSYDPYTGQTKLVDDPGFDVMPGWEADKIFKNNPGMEQFYMKEPAPGMGANMVRIVKKPSGGRSGYGSPGMESGRLARATSGLGQMIFNMINEGNVSEKAKWDADRQATETYDDGQVFEGTNPSALKQDSYAELLDEWLQNGTVSEAKVQAFLDTDLVIFGPKSTNKLWLIALSNKDYGAFKNIRTTLRSMFHSGLGEKSIAKYLASEQVNWPGLEYEDYQTLQTSGPLQTESKAAAEQVQHGPLRTR